MSKPIALPMAPPAPAVLVPCTECGKCCTYVAVGINAPTTPRTATDILWYLYHERVSVWVDSDGEWSVVFETRCRNLDQALLCTIYEKRPLICRDFDNESCEVNDPGGSRCFSSPAQFLEYLRLENPKLHRRVMKSFAPAELAPATA